MFFPFRPTIRVCCIRHGGKLFRTRSPVDLKLGYRPLRITLDPDAPNYVLRTLLGPDGYEQFLEHGGPVDMHNATRMFHEWCEHHGIAIPERVYPAPEPPERPRPTGVHRPRL